jgi:glutathione transport system substrate-binding protein
VIPKKFLWLICSAILVSGLILTGCSSSSTSTVPSQTQTPVTKPSVSTSTIATPVTSSVASSSSTSAKQPQIGGTFKMIYSSSVAVWDAPTEAASFLDMGLTNLVYDRILNFDNTGNPTPRLAAGYNLSSDGLTLTLPVKKGIKFQDGTDLTAKDIKYHIENLSVFGAKMGVAGDYKNVTSIDTPDNYTVVLHLKRPDASLSATLSLNAGVVNSSAAVQKPVTSSTKAKDHVSGTGPYSYVEWQRDVYFKVTRFANYWDTGKPYFNNYEVNFVADQTTGVMTLKSGAAQGIYNISAKNAADLKSNGYTIVASPFANFVLVPDGANVDSPWSKLKVRQAVEYALDKNSFANTFGYGYYKPLHEVVGPEVGMAYNPDVQPRSYDPAKARQLLAEAGYPNGFETSIYCNLADDKNLIGAIQGYLKDVGINAQIQAGDSAKYNGEWAAKGWKNGLIFRAFGFQMNFITNLTNWWRNAANGGSMFVSMYYPDGWDKLCDSTIQDPNPQTRAASVKNIVKAISDQAIAIPICSSPMLAAFDKSIGGTETFAPISPHLQCVSGLYLK